jgi:hypothetical protein
MCMESHVSLASRFEEDLVSIRLALETGSKYDQSIHDLRAYIPAIEACIIHKLIDTALAFIARLPSRSLQILYYVHVDEWEKATVLALAAEESVRNELVDFLTTRCPIKQRSVLERLIAEDEGRSAWQRVTGGLEATASSIEATASTHARTALRSLRVGLRPLQLLASSLS